MMRIIHIVLVEVVSAREQHFQTLDDFEVLGAKFCLVFGTLVTLLRGLISDILTAIIKIRKEWKEEHDKA